MVRRRRSRILEDENRVEYYLAEVDAGDVCSDEGNNGHSKVNLIYNFKNQ